LISSTYCTVIVEVRPMAHDPSFFAQVGPSRTCENMQTLVTFCRCRVTSNVDAGGNNVVDYHPSQSTYPPPPAKRPYRRPIDATSASGARETKSESKLHGGSVIHGQNVRGTATGGSGEVGSRCSAVLESVSGGQDKLGSEENVGQQSDPRSTSDSTMQTLWSGQLAVNGSEICSAELVSRCHIQCSL